MPRQSPVSLTLALALALTLTLTLALTLTLSMPRQSAVSGSASMAPEMERAVPACRRA